MLTCSAGIVNAKYRLVKVDLAESREIAKRFCLHATPTFLMFFEGKLLGATSLGGHAVRIAPTTRNVHLTNKMDHPPRTLLVQGSAKQQVVSEKILRKELFAWDLALDADVGEAGLRTLDRFIRTTDSKKVSNPSQQCVVGMIISNPDFEASFASTLCQLCRTAQGRRVSVATMTDDGVCPHCGIVPKSIVEASPAVSTLASIAHVFVYRHIRAPTLHRLAERWADQVTQKKSEQVLLLPFAAMVNSCSDVNVVQMLRGAEVEVHKGLTKDTLFREMEHYLQVGRRGLFAPKDGALGMALSATDTIIMNTHLTTKPHSA
ncbi:hypothetical protein DYB35_010138 [Aphanomyces astaci]|uniref:Thioredoxin domain-containing protein n=1 Tax=Aphanomyces astaci TaxID=112090 RepID=A0A3R7AR95_APHAT|nr:hypothetical protein DYB35_010138 [Aphanomyces astaci]